MDHFFKHVQFAIHREGMLFIGIFSFITLMLFFLWTPLGIVGLILTLWCIYFFRNPTRITPQNPNLVIAPADGTIESISITQLPNELNETDEATYHCISIFMNIFNVHVNRYPINGIIKKILYIPGKFLNASLHKANKDNERNIILFETDTSQKIAIVQIAGCIARRIVCYAQTNNQIQAGQELGLIRFGSRVDIYIPSNIIINVLEGQLTIAGETVLADISKISDQSKTTSMKKK